MSRYAAPIATLMLSTACGAPAPPPGTGGTDLEPGRCGRGMVVVSSDYQSSNVSLLSGAGEVLSESFLSSASADAGLSAPLSGDVVVPTAPMDAEVVLLDRYPASVLSFVRVDDAVVRAQLDVSTGFAANPQDYLALSESKAYVSRFETNVAAGQQPLDAGGDVLVLDPSQPSLVGRIDLATAMTDAPGYEPRANRMLFAAGRVYVLLSAYAQDFASSAPSRLVVVDPLTDAVVGVHVLDGLHGCSAMAVDESVPVRLAVACTGQFSGSTAAPDSSGVAVLALDGDGVVEQARYMASDLVGRPLGFSIDFVTPERLIATAMGELDAGGGAAIGDVAFELALDSGDVRELHRTLELPFELGEVRCSRPRAELEGLDDQGCGWCYLADGEAGTLRRFAIEGGQLEADGEIVADPRIGLPPRTVGRF